MVNAAHDELTPLMTIKDVMNYLGISRPTLLRWRSDGTLVPIRVHGVVRYRQDDVARLIDERREGVSD